MKIALFCLYVMLWLSPISKTSEVAQVVSTHKGKVRLLCTLPDGQNATVSWISPRGEYVVSGSEILPKFRNFASLLGNYHLLIKYTVYPDHVGVWMCVVGSPVLKAFGTNLTLLVPPSDMMPSITSSADSGSKNKISIIMCTGHYALPAVTLTWRRASGNDIEFETSFPRFIVSKSGLVSASVELILTEEHRGSNFECSSQHQTSQRVSSASFHFPLLGKRKSCTVQFLAEIIDLGSNHEMLVSPTNINITLAPVQSKQMNRGLVSLSSSDRAFFIIIVGFTLVCFTVAFLLYKFQNKWTWKNTNIVARHTLMKEKGMPTDAYLHNKKTAGHNLLRNRVAFGFQMFLILVLVLILPVYYKGLDVPSMSGVDHVTAIFMGSALWLDCRNLFHGDDVIKVKWKYNGESFYHQYTVSSQSIGQPQNGSKALLTSARVSSVGTGQIAIWPIYQDRDEGTYTCEVFINGQEKRTLATKVLVLPKPAANLVIVWLVSISIVCAVIVLSLLFSNCIKFLPNAGNEIKTEE